ncbi:bacterial alpha-L-rhamnosidase, partial [Colletotrichum lupini]
RLGWTGDVTAFGPTSVFLYDTSGFWKGWMKDVNAEQADAGGIPPVLIPHVPQGWTANGYPPTAIWGDVAVIHPYNIFQAFGDRDLLREHWPGVKLWLDHGVRRDSTGLWDRSTFQFGDWLDPLAPPWDPAASQTNKFLVADAYLVHGIGLAAQMAEWLGETADADRYNTAYSNLKTKFQAAWINIDGTMVSETQTGLILPLYFGLIPDAQVANATQRLRAIIEQNQYKVGTGFAATHYLGLGLSAVNATDTFYGMIQQEEVPGWLYQVKMGGTTTWERWDSMLPDGKINPGDMTSFNHYAYGSVADWMHKTIGGISPAAPGYKRISIAPIPGGMLTNAACSLYTQYGLVSAEWWLESSNFRLQVTIPPNTVATITIPAVGRKAGRTTEVGSGTYTF